MKLFKVLFFGFALSVLSVTNSFAFWWTPQERDCTATLTYTVEIEGVEIEFTETWNGTKKVCKDGDSFCWASDCA